MNTPLSTKQGLLEVVAPSAQFNNKVTIVGAGAVGMACTVTILSKNISTDIAIVDVDENKLMGEMLDLQQGSQFINNAKIVGSTDYEITKNSRLCVITAGIRQRPDQTRLDLVEANTNLMKVMIPALLTYSPSAILLIVTNPVDILTYVAWKISGLPKNRVIGSGTNLDSSRFRYFISERLGIAPGDCHGWIVGEHGDSSVAVWSSVNIAGVPLNQINPKIGSENDEEKWNELHQHVINSGYEIIKLKGSTCWAIGFSVSSLADAILRNRQTIHAVSTYIKGLHGITDEVFLSLPAVLGENGVVFIIKQNLTEKERELLNKSVKIMCDVQSKLSV